MKSAVLRALTLVAVAVVLRTPAAGWEKLTLPDNLDLMALAELDGVIFVSAGDVGVYRSADTGRTWVTTGTAVNGWLVTGLSAAGAGIWAYGHGGQPSQAQAWFSNNMGTTWGSRSTGVQTIEQPMCIADGPAGTLAMGLCFYGVNVSADGGLTWTASSSGLPQYNPGSSYYRTTFTLARVGSRMLAGTAGGVYCSMDGGASWDTANNGIDPLQEYVTCFASRHDTLFASVGCDSVQGGVYRSTDSGHTWSLSSSGLANAVVSGLAWVGEEVIAATDSGIYVSSDRGQTWLPDTLGRPISYPSPRVYGTGIGAFAGVFRGAPTLWHRGLGDMTAVSERRAPQGVITQQNGQVRASRMCCDLRGRMCRNVDLRGRVLVVVTRFDRRGTAMYVGADDLR